MKNILVSVALSLMMATSSVGCRGLARIAIPLAVHAAAAAIHLAVWYSITRPVVVYTAPPMVSTSQPMCTVPAQGRLYIVARSADGYWYRVRTTDGREGWVRASDLQGSQRL